MNIISKLKQKLYQKDIADFYSSKPLAEENKKSKNLIGDVLITAGIMIAGALGTYFAWTKFFKKGGKPSGNTTTTTSPTPTTSTTEKLDSLEDYLKSKGWLDEYELFKPMLKDGQLSDTEKQLIDYFNTLPKNYQNNSAVVELLEGIISDGKVTSDELIGFKDWDKDGLENLLEMSKYSTDPLKPNPNFAYLLTKGMPIDKAKIVLPLDLDGEMDKNEKNFDDLLLNYKQLLIVPTLKKYLVEKASDGKITSDELTTSDNFAYLVKEMYDIVSDEPKAKDKISDTDYAANLGLKLNFDVERATEATAKAIAEYAVAVKDENLPERLVSLEALTHITQSPEGHIIVTYRPNIAGEKFDTPFDIWFAAELSNHSFDSVKKYLWAARGYIKQIDLVVNQYLAEKPGRYRWDDLEGALLDYWDFHVRINEKNERALPLEEPAVRELFSEPDQAEIVERASFLNSAELLETINQTQKLINSCKMTDRNHEAFVDSLINNLEKMPSLHNLTMHILRYRADNETELKEFLLEQGWPEIQANSLAHFYASILETPDPLKVFLISWNRFVTDQVNRSELVKYSTSYKEIMINEGLPLVRFGIKFRGSEYLTPEQQSAQPIGIAPVKFSERYLTFENLGEILTAMGMYGRSSSNHEETRVEAAILYAHSIGYPLLRAGVSYKDSPVGHGDTGIFLTDHVYNLMKETFGDKMIDWKEYKFPYVTNGWTFEREIAKRELKSYEVGDLSPTYYWYIDFLLNKAFLTNT